MNLLDPQIHSPLHKHSVSGFLYKNERIFISKTNGARKSNECIFTEIKCTRLVVQDCRYKFHAFIKFSIKYQTVLLFSDREPKYGRVSMLTIWSCEHAD